MILNIIIVAWLVLAALYGYHRGLVAVILNLIGNILVLVIAGLYAQDLASWFNRSAQVTSTSGVMVAFFIILIGGRILLSMIIRWTRLLTYLPVIRQVNGLAGGTLALVMHYGIVLIVLSVLMIAPSSALLEQYSSSSVAQFVLKTSPLKNAMADWLQNPDSDQIQGSTDL